MREKLLFIIVFLGVLVTACVPAGAPVDQSRPVADSATLDETEWWLAEIAGEEPAGQDREPPIYLRFFAAGPERQENEFSAFAGCNYLGGFFALEEGEPLFPRLDRTDFPCDDVPPAVMEQEEAILAALEEAVGLRRAADDRLLVVGEEGEVRLVYVARPAVALDTGLTGDEWVLVSLNGEAPLSDVRGTLRFETDGGEPGMIAGARVRGIALCNSYGGELRTAADGVFNVAEIESTEEYCDEPAGTMEQESAYLDALRNAAGYRLQGDRLELLDADGEVTLTFERDS